jgi:hypothetical protein
MPEPMPSRLMSTWVNTNGGMPKIMVTFLRKGKRV